MPEGPEVKLTTVYLDKVLSGNVLEDWFILDETDAPNFERFEESLPMIVQEVGCKGKLIFMILFNEFETWYVLHHMRMSGSWVEQRDDHCRWRLDVSLSNGHSRRKIIYFRDPRVFATVCFTKDKDEFEEALAKLGPDVMNKEFTLRVWKRIVAQHPNKNITSFLMDQALVSGIGNYLKSEVLYYAGVSPLRKVGSLTEKEVEKLFEGIILKTRQSYNDKGMSLKDYTDSKGRKGFFEFQLKVYSQPDAKRLKTSDGRSTWYDPNVQK